MRELFEFLSIFDWITPSFGFLEDILNDPTLMQSNSWTFFMPYDRCLNHGWNAFQIEDLLNRHGIKTWGGQLTDGEFFFSVKLEHARWAEYVLLRYGVPIQEESMGPPAPRRKKVAKSPRQKHQKPTEDPLSFLDNFFDKYS